jgi:hypothetical protein
MTEREPWEELFAPAPTAQAGHTSRMHLLRRGGRAFLLLPDSPRLAAKGLELYAPQTGAARWLKKGSKLAIRFGVFAGLEKKSLPLSPSDPFANYLNKVAGTESPQFAMLAGNPNAAGQRCIFLSFDKGGRPVAVTKAGARPEATALIEHEEEFLKKVPPGLTGIPKLRSTFRSDRVRALTTDFLPGRSPLPHQWMQVAKLLSQWVDSARKLKLRELVIWKRLLAAAGASLSADARELGDRAICPVLYHGDFAPWNIKVHQGSWTLLDWDRGELGGIPLWDWLHFVIQPAILVEHANSSTIIQRLLKLFEFPEFIDYAERAGIRGLEWPLTRAYLDYSFYVVRQSEGLDRVRHLADVTRAVAGVVKASSEIVAPP